MSNREMDMDKHEMQGQDIHRNRLADALKVFFLTRPDAGDPAFAMGFGALMGFMCSPQGAEPLYPEADHIVIALEMDRDMVVALSKTEAEALVARGAANPALGVGTLESEAQA